MLGKNRANHPKKSPTWIAAAALIAGAVVGLGSTSAIAGLQPTNSNMAELSPAELEVETNAKGLTFGSALALSAEGEEPDLVSVFADSGQIGYAFTSDLEAASGLVDTPSEASKYQKSVSSKLAKKVPVYESDGVTVIGTFTITPSEGFTTR